MDGQELDIRIVTDKRMREQTLWRYKYEVLPSASPYAGKIDIIFSEHLLRAHHSYRILVCTDQRNPRILQVLEEIGDSEDQ